MLGWLALLLQASVPPATPEPLPPPVAQPSDAEVWTMVRRANRPDAYRVYLRRFPEGEHAEAARIALGAEPEPEQDVAAAIPSPFMVSAQPPSPCTYLSAQNSAERQEAEAYRAARLSNRAADFESYLVHYPAGACKAEAEAAIASRNRWRLTAGVTVPGLGPLPRRRLREVYQMMSDMDYPPAAIRAEQQGRVIAAWEVAEDGVVESCRIVGSSGSAALDAATCRIITARLRYDPERDAAGRPVRAADHTAIRWILPIEDPLPPPAPQGAH
jgi:TonB family protein